MIRRGITFTPTQPNAIRIESILVDEIDHAGQKPRMADQLQEAKKKAAEHNLNRSTKPKRNYK